MYLNLFTRWISKIWYSVFGKGLRRSPALPWLVILVLIGLPSLGWYLHRRGRFATLKRDIKGQQQSTPISIPSPGGMEPIVLERSPTPGITTPELTSVTILPGLGMDVLQLTANVPGRGTTLLLANPTVQEVVDDPAHMHTALYDTRGAIEAPWGGLLMGLLSPIGTSMTVNWQTHTIQVPTEVVARGVDEAGLLSRSAVDSQQVTPLADGAVATGVLQSSNFDEHWLSRVDLRVAVQLGASDLTLILSAKNTGSAAVPFGVGWHPRFQIPDGNREGTELRLPEGDELEVANKSTGLPSGRFVNVPPDLAHMQRHPAAPGSDSILASLVHLKPGLLDSVPAAEFRNPMTGYGLRLSSPSSNTRALRVIAPAGTNYVSLGLQTNYDDPFGREWDGPEGSGIVTLLPGQSFEWKIRLEIFPIARHNPANSN